MSEQLIKVAGWNVCDGLSKSVAMPNVVERIKSLDADIVVLPEAFAEVARTNTESQEAEMLAQATDQLSGSGYSMRSILYGDHDGRKDRHGFALLTRIPDAGEVRAFGLDSRRVLGQHVGDLALTIVGVHLDDRTEVRRRSQASNLLNQLKTDDANVILGDFNAMHRNDLRARLLRTAKPFVDVLPTVNPGETAPNLAKLRRVGSLGSRLTSMANGGTMDKFIAAGYVDVDGEHQPTKGPVQLDHIMTNFYSTQAELNVAEYRVHPTTKTESDHRPLSAVIEY